MIDAPMKSEVLFKEALKVVGAITVTGNEGVETGAETEADEAMTVVPQPAKRQSEIRPAHPPILRVLRTSVSKDICVVGCKAMGMRQEAGKYFLRL
jgi:hypothetical protein